LILDLFDLAVDSVNLILETFKLFPQTIGLVSVFGHLFFQNVELVVLRIIFTLIHLLNLFMVSFVDGGYLCDQLVNLSNGDLGLLSSLLELFS